MTVKTMLVAAFAVTGTLSLSAIAETPLEQRVYQLEQQNLTRNQLQSDMSMQLIELQKEVKELRGIIEEHDYKLQQIQERQRDLYRDIEKRFSGMSPVEAAPIDTPADTLDSTDKTSGDIISQVKPSEGSGDARAEFEAAFVLVRNKQYAQSINAFEAFLAKHPKSDYSDNARFWIGQVYFAQSNLTESEKHFSRLRNDFPDSSKMSATLLKLAEIQRKQNNWLEAKKLYSEVVSRYSGAPQQLARKALKDIKQAGH